MSNTTNQCNEFQEERLKNYIKAWEAIIADPEIVETVSDLKLDFIDNLPSCSTTSNIGFSKIKEPAIDNEIAKLLTKQAIMKCAHKSGEYISLIFLRPKHDNTCRLILNLKSLNNDMSCVHFKMETISLVLYFITPGCYLASIDLKDAYYSVPAHTDYTKYLIFFWKGQLHKVLVLPNGLCSAPRKFTKLMKPPVAILRMKGHIIIY